MYDNNQYEKDLSFIDKIEKLISKKIEFMLYFGGLVSCMIAHVLYCALFYYFQIKEMAMFNVFSVLCYLILIIIIGRVKDKVNLVYAGLMEIIIHATVATIYVGWKPDFGMFLLMIVPVLFLMPYKNKNVPFVMMIVSVSLYGILRYVYDDPTNSVYNWENSKAGTIIYFINFIIGSFVLLYITFIYTVMNHYMKCKLRVQNEQLKVMALIDPLTKLNNRRAMNHELKKIYEDCIANDSNYIIGIGDIDDFKKVNDTYGHEYGDIVLSEVAGIIKKQLPEHSHVARWGGEEFLFAIPKTDLDDGFKHAQSIVSEVGKQKFKKDDIEFSVTMTIGISEGVPNQDIEKIISKADKRLYKGKNNGKNHTEYTD